jgi:hypothetical protein
MADRREGFMNTNNAIVYLLIAICMGLISWSLKTQVEMGQTMVVLKEKVEQISGDKEKDESQDSQLTRQWKLISQLKDRVMQLEFKNNIELKPFEVEE